MRRLTALMISASTVVACTTAPTPQPTARPSASEAPTDPSACDESAYRPGTLSLTVSPTAIVSRNGDRLGRTPLHNVELPPGEHLLKLDVGPYTTSVMVDVTQDRPTALYLDTVFSSKVGGPTSFYVGEVEPLCGPFLGSVSFALADCLDLALRWDDRDMSVEGPTFSLLAPAGEHEISVRCDGHWFTKAVTVQPETWHPIEWSGTELLGLEPHPWAGPPSEPADPE